MSDTYAAQGTVSEIAGRGEACIARIANPRTVQGDLILSRDLPGGIVVARIVFDYPERGLPGGRALARSILTFEARQSRYRIVHSSIETDPALPRPMWSPAKEFEGRPSPLRAAVNALNASIADCVSRATNAW